MKNLQIQTITAGCQCIQELESHLLMQVMLHARYLDKYFFKYDIRLENHLLIRTNALVSQKIITFYNHNLKFPSFTTFTLDESFVDR